MIDPTENLLPIAERELFFRSLRAYPDRCVRPRPDRRDLGLPFETEGVPWYAEGRRLRDAAIRPGGFLHYAAADYYIQDGASMLPLALVDWRDGDRVCDVCAAPGGKATAIAERLGAEGVLMANEVIRSRVDVLKFALARTGRANYVVTHHDPSVLADRFGGGFDKVVLDVPCSGQSLLSKSKQSESAFSQSQIELCAARGRRILGDAVRLLRNGGTLIYSTCTFSVEENEAQVAWLLERFPGAWEPVRVAALAEWESPVLQGCYRLWPHRDGCAGGFAAALRLVGDLGEAEVGSGAREDATRPERVARSRGGTQQGQKMAGRRTVGRIAGGRPVSRIAAERSLPLQSEGLIEALGVISGEVLWEAPGGWLVEPGVARWLREVGTEELESAPLAFLSGKQWVPSHALALLRDAWFAPHRSIELEDAQAASYMEGASLHAGSSEALAFESDAEGRESRAEWAVARWRGRPLGWLKRSAGRWNNHLPTWARVQGAVASSGG
jgi:16S rRNA C967 or C1407 C5-methylase (RsmB/RsmF family)/NOL1/NOP2/fmu family ribosome biogenesis protein